MAWPILKYSRKQVALAGEVLIAREFKFVELVRAIDVLTNWRACHGYPINTFQSTLRRKLKKIDSTGLVAQRLKRTPSILNKLRRFKNMNLARMQDIGGLRAVVGNLRQVRELEKSYRDSKRFTHKLVSEYDYISNPKASGYRSVHLVYKYQHPEKPEYDGLLLELQIRTKLRHAWATAVETMGTFLDQSLKSSEGPEEWLKFFALAGSAFAYLEDCPPVPGYQELSKAETFKAVADEAFRLGVHDKLSAYSAVIQANSQVLIPAAYYLIVLDFETKSVEISPYRRDRLEEASEKYSEIERKISEGEKKQQAVLVSAGSIDALRRAYPNYFLDTHDFLRKLARIVKASKDAEIV